MLDFDPTIESYSTGRFSVGWVEERNPTKYFGISTQPTIEAEFILTDTALFLFIEP